jgi:hypothetical protein
MSNMIRAAVAVCSYYYPPDLVLIVGLMMFVKPSYSNHSNVFIYKL